MPEPVRRRSAFARSAAKSAAARVRREAGERTGAASGRRAGAVGATVLAALGEWDDRLFTRAARARWRGAAPWLGRLSRTADHGLLWWGCAAALDATRSRTARRAALRGIGAMLIASTVTNVAAKSLTRRARPSLAAVPLTRQLLRQPWTSSFPSGHSASAAAFLTGVALESRELGALVAPVALSVMASRVYVGVHFPGDVLAGAVIGAGAGLATLRWWPLGPPGDEAEAGRTVPAPAAPNGEGLHVVVNSASGNGGSGSPTERAKRLAELLPHAAITVCELPHGEGSEDGGSAGSEDELPKAIEEAARAAAAYPDGRGILGVCGGDGTVALAASAALRHGLPLAVFPGGTFNHFAGDLGAATLEDTAAAIRGGHAVSVDVARAVPDEEGAREDGEPGEDRPGGRIFLNTFSVGIYPDLVRARERLERYAGKWPALAAALIRVPARAEPIEVTVDGRPRRLWMLFAGNGRYAPSGFAPVRRGSLHDGRLDLRMVDGSRPWARTRLVLAFLTGTLHSSRVYREESVRELRLSRHAGEAVALDGEAVDAPSGLRLEKLPGALTVYRPF